MEPPSKQSKTILGTFLESVAPASNAEPPRPTPAPPAAQPPGNAPVGAPPPAPAPAAQTTEPPTLSTVLRYLTSTHATGQDVTITDIASALRASTVETADVVQKMAYSGLVTLDGEPGREFVRLTDQGRGLTSVA